jgi:hypothetical protein
VSLTLKTVRGVQTLREKSTIKTCPHEERRRADPYRVSDTLFIFSQLIESLQVSDTLC